MYRFIPIYFLMIVSIWASVLPEFSFNIKLEENPVPFPSTMKLPPVAVRSFGEDVV